MNSFRLWRRGLVARFLGFFAEVRALRNFHVQHEEQMRILYARQHALEDENQKIGSLNHELSLLSEKNLNLDRELAILRGQLDGIREISEREVHGIKQVADFWAIRMGGRQMFGTAPDPDAKMPLESPKDDAPVSARHASRVLTERFLEEAMQFGMRPPAEPEYSSRDSR